MLEDRIPLTMEIFQNPVTSNKGIAMIHDGKLNPITNPIEAAAVAAAVCLVVLFALVALVALGALGLLSGILVPLLLGVRISPDLKLW